MTITAAPSTIEAPTREASAQKNVRYLVFILCSTLYLLPFMRFLLQGTDEGTLVYGAVRIVHGQAFARDFFEIIGPGTFYWLAAFFKVFGVTFAASRICLFLTSLGTGVLMYFLSRKVCRRYQVLPCILLGATYFGMLWPSISHHVDSNFFALLSVACVVLWQERRKDILLISAGVWAGTTMSVYQPKGLLLLLSILLWLWMQYRRRLISIFPFILVIGGCCSVIGVVLVYFWSQDSLWHLVYVNFVWPRRYGLVNVVPYGQGIIHYYWDQWVIPKGALNWTIGMATVLITPFLFIATLPALLVILSARCKWNTLRPEVLLLWLCGWALWLSELHRKDIHHLVFGSPLLIILCVHLLGERREKIADLTLQILSISAGFLACFNLFMVLAAHTLTTRVGSVAVFKSDPVLTFLNDHVTPGEDIFVYPYNPMYYFLSATSNPTRYSILIRNYNTRSQFEEVIRDIDEHQVKYVVWDTSFAARAAVFFPGSKSTRTEDLVVEPYLESHYKLVQESSGICLMERMGEGQRYKK